MRIFIAGATGVLGRRVIPLLRADGHKVVGLSRSATSDERLSQLAAEPRRGEIFSADDVLRITADCHAILHLATAIPTHFPSKLSDWTTNDRLRREATRNLLNAALAHRCRLYLQQSVLYVYGDRAGAMVDENTPLAERLGGVLESALEMETLVAEAHRKQGLPTMTLRFGTFYGPDAAHTLSMLDLVRRRKLPLIGPGGNVWNMLHLDDAARAVAAAVAQHESCPGEVFNIADGAPLTMGEMLRELAELLGAKPPRQLPLWLARWLVAPHLLQPLLLSLRVDGRKARTQLGWQPQYSTSRAGHQAVIEALRL